MGVDAGLSGGLDFDRLIGELSRLQVRYPKLLHHLSRSEDSIYIWYFIEDLAIECVRVLGDMGIQAKHNFGNAKAVQIPLAGSIPEEGQNLLLSTLEKYLNRCAAGNL